MFCGLFESALYVDFSIVRTLDSKVCCRRLFCYNNTTEEDDGTLLSFFSFLTQRSRQQHQAIVTFFAATPQKKTMSQCRCLLLFKHRKDKTHKKKKTPRKGRELTFKFPLCLSFLAPTFAFLLLSFRF